MNDGWPWGSALKAENLYKIISEETDHKHLWVGYSGGLDSHVLLHLCHEMCKRYPEYKLSAIHVHHGLSQQADVWVEHCEEVCTALQVPLSVIWVDANVYDGSSPEEVAREARLNAWENLLQESECLLLAHHAMDQAETILLRLFRGTGPLGLGGMPGKGKMGKGEFIRPFLSLSKENIIEYAEEQGLQWIEDESNANLRFDRNFLRHEIMPRLSARWPRVVRSVSRAGSLCLETATAVQITAASEYERVKIEDPKNESLSVSGLLALEPVHRKGVLRYWLQRNGFALPSRDHMERIEREILLAKPGSKPRLKISQYEIKRHKNVLSVNAIGIE